MLCFTVNEQIITRLAQWETVPSYLLLGQLQSILWCNFQSRFWFRLDIIIFNIARLRFHRTEIMICLNKVKILHIRFWLIPYFNLIFIELSFYYCHDIQDKTRNMWDSKNITSSFDNKQQLPNNSHLCKVWGDPDIMILPLWVNWHIEKPFPTNL